MMQHATSIIRTIKLDILGKAVKERVFIVTQGKTKLVSTNA